MRLTWGLQIARTSEFGRKAPLRSNIANLGIFSPFAEMKCRKRRPTVSGSTLASESGHLSRFPDRIGGRFLRSRGTVGVAQRAEGAVSGPGLAWGTSGSSQMRACVTSGRPRVTAKNPVNTAAFAVTTCQAHSLVMKGSGVRVPASALRHLGLGAAVFSPGSLTFRRSDARGIPTNLRAQAPAPRPRNRCRTRSIRTKIAAEGLRKGGGVGDDTLGIVKVVGLRQTIAVCSGSMSPTSRRCPP